MVKLFCDLFFRLSLRDLHLLKFDRQQGMEADCPFWGSINQGNKIIAPCLTLNLPFLF